MTDTLIIKSEEINRVLSLINQISGITNLAANAAAEADEVELAGACEGAGTLARQASSILMAIENRGSRV